MTRWVCVLCGGFVSAKLVEADPYRPGCFKGHWCFEGHRFDAVLTTYDTKGDPRRPKQARLPGLRSKQVQA